MRYRCMVRPKRTYLLARYPDSLGSHNPNIYKASNRLPGGTLNP